MKSKSLQEGQTMLSIWNEDDEIMVVTENSIVDGDINTSENLHVKGKVEGNIISKENVKISEFSIVKGNVSASIIHLHEGNILGDVNARSEIYIGEDGHVKGDVNADLIIVNGTIEGNMNGVKAIFEKGAIVHGDINVEIVERASSRN
ncbi:cytoskeletal protein CcmA (bactofilin family) [Breznakia sp. PF5-3]|uniref:bactofilin family protein n=1 Tax=unclassified Breznakia TaxID=2623764 RepID=UPI002405AEDD|nr:MULTISPECIES: polymer-forming cytoskeletal protein [unclassified Breznakia]MDF9825430.1 cytoskeletal protein CcmA (bactofilin family) [Breznakia sp. PM6-1]MDF9836308.1 cytoskeletal protein CcmA (bactofilin family) [Breznakia sp. PF5-3]MDF9838992.1 cytoskeletal protein CcmA (bactofilin family) [Breznakia sp. PFB2-8]MDF9861005.1 cytoskeletal protein CcmA (bactofilin family) [Breznakia sp. PH5-24]